MTEAEAMRTDADWEHLARTDAYWSVLTHDQFRQKNFDAGARERFFGSGEEAVEYLFHCVRRHIDPAFAPARALDFGCGVGRVLLPLARRCRAVVGVDVSDTMLREAAANARGFGLGNVELVKSDDALSAVHGRFDLVHSVIVLQHIPPQRGVGIFRRLVDLVAPGGVGALHVNFAVPAAPPAAAPNPVRALVRALVKPFRPRPHAEPRMQMNAYPLGELLGVVRAGGARWVHAELADDNGCSGAHLLFRKES